MKAGHNRRKSLFTIRINIIAWVYAFLTISEDGSPTMDNLEWLREHMRNHISGSAPMEATKGVLRFRGAPPAPATRDSGATLDLVYQAAEMVKGIEDRANEIGTYARSIAERASEKLQLAEKRIQELEAERRAADACISEARARIEDAEEALRLERSRVKAAEDQLGQLEIACTRGRIARR